MDLVDCVRTAHGFASWTHAEKIRFLGWYLHAYRRLETFGPSDIKGCYVILNLDPPADFGTFFKAMTSRKPKEALRTASGYKLEMRVRNGFDAKYSQRASAVHVDKLLSDLPSLVPDLVERTYLDEALICFRNRAFRAAIIMCWNLAYSHLCEFVLTKHLVAFNTQLPIQFPKHKLKAVSKKDDFSEFKESDVLQVCRSAMIISNSLSKVLKEKLDRRNTAAHPSAVVISQLTAEEFIKDLIENVVIHLI